MSITQERGDAGDDAVTVVIPTVRRHGRPQANPAWVPRPSGPPQPGRQLFEAPPMVSRLDPRTVPPGRSRRPWLVLGVVGAVLTLAVLILAAGTHRTMSVHGTVTVRGMTGAVTPGSSCVSTSSTALSVTIYDATGKLVGATTATTGGTARHIGGYYGYYGSTSSYADSCEYAFAMPDVPAGDAFYRVKVGNAPGDGVPFSAAELSDGGAQVVLGA